MITLNLSILLAERGMTQSELAQLTGIRPSTICDMYNNNCTFLKISNIEKICTVLNCDISDFISVSGGADK